MSSSKQRSHSSPYHAPQEAGGISRNSDTSKDLLVYMSVVDFEVEGAVLVRLVLELFAFCVKYKKLGRYRAANGRRAESDAQMMAVPTSITLQLRVLTV
jgi:hypothetical protein